MQSLCRLLLMSILSLGISIASYANTSAAQDECQPIEELGNLNGILFYYQIDTEETITIPFCFDQAVLTGEQITSFEQVQNEIIAKLATQSQPVNATMKIALTSASDTSPVLIFSMLTKVYQDKEGMIQTEVLIPQYQKEIAETEENFGFSIDWAGAMGKSRAAKTELWQQIATALTSGQTITPELLKDKSILLDAYQDIDIELTMPKLSFNLGERFNFLMEGLNLKAFYKDILSPYHIDLTIPTLRFGSDTNALQLKLKDFVVKTVTELSHSGLEMAKGNMSIEQVLVENNGVQLNHLNLESHGEEKEDVVNGFITTELKELVLPETFFGKTYRIHYQGDFTLRQLDVASLKKFQDKFKELQRQQYSHRPMSEEMMGMVIIGQFMQALPKLWAKSPEFVVNNLQLDMAQGKLIGQGSIGIDGTKPLVIKDLSKLKMALKAQAQVVADKAILKLLLNHEGYYGDEDLEGQIDELVKEGKLIAIDKERYQVTLNLQEGELLINGQSSDWEF